MRQRSVGRQKGLWSTVLDIALVAMTLKSGSDSWLHNDGLEQTGSAANGLSGPCSSIQCWPDVEPLGWARYVPP
jgi:hypothetical protein